MAVISYLLKQPFATGFSVEFRAVGLSGVVAAMGPFLERWRRIGTRLYLALGIAVILTLISGAVGVFYFEQSGDLNYQVRNESVPALEATWTVARETERLRNLGLGLAAEPDLGFQGLARGTVVDSLERLDTALNVVSGVAELSAGAQAVSDAAYDLADVIDNLERNRDALLGTNRVAADYRLILATSRSDVGESEAALSVLRQVLEAKDETELKRLWDEFSGLYAAGIDPRVASLGRGPGRILCPQPSTGAGNKHKRPSCII